MAKTPLEQAIAEQTDRRARYDAKMRREGNVRLSVWCPAVAAADVRHLVHCLTLANGDKHAQLRDLLASWDHH